LTTNLPFDPDVEDPEAGEACELASRERDRWPRLPAGVLVAVFIGGVAGGLVRCGLGLAASVPDHAFPWDVLTINVVGAFALALLLVLLAEAAPPNRYLRPALGTGFLGAFTTFSSLAAASDQLFAHAHPVMAAGYVAGSLVGGVVACLLGLLAGRSISTRRDRLRERRIAAR